MIAALDAFRCEDFVLAEELALEAVRLRPDDEVARDVLETSRKTRHGFGSGYYERWLAEKQQEFAKLCADLDEQALADYFDEVIAGLDAFEIGEFDVAAHRAQRALDVRPDGAIAQELLRNSRRGCDVGRWTAMREYRNMLTDADFVELMIEALDAFLREEFDVVDEYTEAALRLRPRNPVASELLLDSRRARHAWGGKYFEDLKRSRRALRDELALTRRKQGPRPPAPP